ncbi:putative redox protein [Halpernia humi]|uniref:Putative redox protein n=1 Tax=Halpernia humi TaxID=493375 RepID=A0A1H6B0D1_9FLAO|nr:OsmC family protein [Halpernia humi]SEG53556.1 putative redox protein [Halpernia humi]
MKIKLNRIGDAYHFKAENERGHIVEMDSRAEFGGQDLAASPMELLLMSLAGCSSIDIISILKKQKQNITSFRTEVEGIRVPIDAASPFKKITLMIYLEGNISKEKALKAADLSFQKYCSVAKTIEPTAEINYKIVLNSETL